MQKFDNFKNCFDVLKKSEKAKALADEIYRTGVIGQFGLAFELAWKTLQELMRAHGIEEAENGSPREILRAGFKYGFLNDESVWLQMLKDRNSATHIYDEEAFNAVLDRVYSSYINLFDNFKTTLESKISVLENSAENKL
ncbi:MULTISPECIES: HI0074 family nucleotidyltransferase substrate-binding subunit [unclassified Fibrobacter]|uniref:HI0074 family nucleotidyltransferase substrate-binding subunit n=1 Tax=unclassified Fibrobacter TaxID=2634177 RepID=UPI00090F0F3A|nr:MULTISPECIES: HI0074 family nucleotidyltransferase substrate-binding subunit [unclassified Fibrobacter]OWV00867.1 nucleotidyltransferase [Fibrobacter sp. UWH3]OWV17300.1 nucleotidyltransferase [Fibrobacter sp. UWH1]SHK84014.1 nucleotidyltransferase substrate binding protein, HI0074 family [Fibrobacter sp. UWH6]